jgi:general secretion pathway protein A
VGRQNWRARFVFCYRARGSVSTVHDSTEYATPSEAFYGLSRPAFSLTPDLRFAYQSRSHARAFEQVTEALRRREGLIVITGEIGTGKTMLCRALLEFGETRTFLSVIHDPCLSVDDLLFQVLRDFGLISKASRPQDGPTAEASRHQLVETLQQFLASLVPLDAQAVIMIDEAQHLAPDVLEQIRLLSNFETDNTKLLQIVLVGQPDLDKVLSRPDMRQLSQRIARRVELHALSDLEVADYIARRLSVASERAPAGTEQGVLLPQFTPAALAAVERFTGGIPRVVNILCDRSLEVGFQLKTRTIDQPLVLTAAERLKLVRPQRATRHAAQGMRTTPAAGMKTGQIAAAAAVLLLAGALGWWWAARTAQTAGPASPAPPNAPAQPGANTPAPTAAGSVNSSPSSGGGERDRPASEGSSAPGAGGAASATESPAPQPMRDSTPLSGQKGDRYDIAVAAFRTPKRAFDVAAEIAAKGLPVSTRADSTGTWYQVMVGPYSSAGEAEAAQRTLAREGFADTRVSSSNPGR